MRCNILFIKTAKCATESIRNHLINFAKSEILTINDYKYSDFFYNNSFNINTNHIWSDEKSINHFYNSIDKSLPTLRITSVRKPLERLYSHYCYGHPYFKKGMNFNEWYIKVSKGELHDGWIVPQWGDRTDNYMWHYMGLNSLDELEEKYDFIFIKEKFQKSLSTFGKLIDYKFKPAFKINSNPKSKQDFKFDNETIALFEERNQNDIKLYKKAKKIFNDKYSS